MSTKSPGRSTVRASTATISSRSSSAQFPHAARRAQPASPESSVRSASAAFRMHAARRRRRARAAPGPAREEVEETYRAGRSRTGWIAVERDDRRLDPDVARAAIQNHRDGIAEIVGDVLRRRRRKWPKRFADGAAMPPPNVERRARATGCDGTRNPTLSCPPVTTSWTRAARGSTNVSGPGQNAGKPSRPRARRAPTPRVAMCHTGER